MLATLNLVPKEDNSNHLGVLPSDDRHGPLIAMIWPAHVQLHQGLLAHGEHLTSRCQGWTDDLARQRGLAPEGT